MFASTTTMKVMTSNHRLDHQDASLSYAKNVLWMVFVSSRGGQNRIRMISALRKSPFNTHQLAKELGLNYRAIQHHISVLEKNNLISHVGEKYGMIYFPSTLLEVNMVSFDEIVANLSQI
jgi:predicted transcriptional regulator